MSSKFQELLDLNKEQIPRAESLKNTSGIPDLFLNMIDFLLEQYEPAVAKDKEEKRALALSFAKHNPRLMLDFLQRCTAIGASKQTKVVPDAGGPGKGTGRDGGGPGPKPCGKVRKAESLSDHPELQDMLNQEAKRPRLD